MKPIGLALLLVAGCNHGTLPPDDSDGGVALDLTFPGPGTDLAASDGASAPRDLAIAPADASGLTFPNQLPGIWLIGWSGGLDHYSWARFQDPKLATVDILPPMGNGGWAPYWTSCSGKGSWALTQKPNTVFITLPQGCDDAVAVLTFDDFSPPMGYPKEAILTSFIDTNPPTQVIVGWKFPNNQCDPNFTVCALPQQ